MRATPSSCRTLCPAVTVVALATVRLMYVETLFAHAHRDIAGATVHPAPYHYELCFRFAGQNFTLALHWYPHRSQAGAPRSEAAYRPIEQDGRAICIKLRCPHPYLGVESLSVPRQALLVNLLVSDAEPHMVGVGYAANRNGKIVEPRNDALQIDTVDEEQSDGGLGLADRVQKNILRVLGFLVGRTVFLGCARE